MALARKPLYAVLFEREVPAVEPPAFPVEPQQDVTGPHGFDREMIEALPGLWYCLHLPNTLLELTSLPAAVIKKCQPLDFAHEILLCPIDLFGPEVVRGSALLAPTLVVCPDSLLAQASAQATNLGFLLETTPYSRLSDETLRAHWTDVHAALAPSVDPLGSPPDFSTRLDLAVTDLPARWLGRQLYKQSQPEVANADIDELIETALEQQVLLNAFSRLEVEQPDPASARARLEDVLKAELPLLRVPLSVVAPGVPARYSRRVNPALARDRTARIERVDPDDVWALSFEDRPDHLVERAAIEFAATHRAVGSTGIGLTLPEVPQEAFQALWQLEDHFRRSLRPSPRKVALLLDRLNETCQPLKTYGWNACVPRASRITAFTSFPIGLLRLEPEGDPLCCYAPIAYRPLLPLTRAVQQEVGPSPSIDFGDGFRILITECIPPNDPVGVLSRRGWEAAADLIKNSRASVSVEHVDVISPADLRSMVERHQPQVLILSAHGHFVRQSNAAGVVIGDTFCLGPELGPMPPVVLLSACTVAPRGEGAVTIADTLIREGAVAVLGTQIPVNVRRNAMLMARFLLYLLESLSRREPEITLLEIWHRAAATNAVNDILSGSDQLMRWATARERGNSPVLQEFMNVRSRGRLPHGRIYAATEAVLGEIADEQGRGAQVRNWMRNPGYIPETIFYSFVGQPDRIRLREPIELPARAWAGIRASSAVPETRDG